MTHTGLKKLYASLSCSAKLSKAPAHAHTHTHTPESVIILRFTANAFILAEIVATYCVLGSFWFAIYH